MPGAMLLGCRPNALHSWRDSPPPTASRLPRGLNARPPLAEPGRRTGLDSAGTPVGPSRVTARSWAPSKVVTAMRAPFALNATEGAVAVASPDGSSCLATRRRSRHPTAGYLFPGRARQAGGHHR